MIKNQARSSLRFPLAMIYPAEANSDPLHGQEPDLVQQNIAITLATVIPGTAVGEAPLLGKNVVDNTRSEGRGLLELEEEVFNAIGRLGTDLGVAIQHTASGKSRPEPDDNTNYIVYRDRLFAAWVTKDRFYHPVVNFTALNTGPGESTLDWVNPPDRWDRFRVLARRTTGGTPPTSITDGTAVALVGNIPTPPFLDFTGSGTFSYSMFVTYDERDGRPDGTPDSDDRVSAAISRASIVNP